MNISRSLREIVKKEKVRMAHLAKAVGVHRVSLYTSLADDGNPERRTIEKILDHLGYDLKFIKRKEGKRTNLRRSKRERRWKKWESTLEGKAGTSISIMRGSATLRKWAK